MLKPWNLLSALLFPVSALGLLVGGMSFRAHSILPKEGSEDVSQRSPASMNRTHLVILRQQYRFYLRVRRRPEMEQAASASYNECVNDTDPSALDGTSLPRHL